MSLRQVVLFAVVMGLVAAAAVWYLERFQAELLSDKFQAMLRKHDAFTDFLREQGAAE